MSQYLTIHDLTSGNAAYQTIATSGTSAQTSAITARRVMITTGGQVTFIAFGTNPTAVVNSSFQMPANTTMLFNFRSGDKVAAITGGSAAAITVVDLD